MKLYDKIENTIIKYSDLLKIDEVDANYNKERFAKIPIEMVRTNQEIYVREGVLKRLLRANENLQRRKSSYCLVVLEGYRSLEKQEIQFEEVLKKLKVEMPDLNEIELYENAHKMIAVPSVAGHPTGGAVDVCIFDKRTGKMLDFGTRWKEFDAGKKNYTFSPEVSRVASRNRKLLKQILEQEGFYQYPAEWWHFSYGDKEWATAYKQKKALYKQVELK